MIDAAAWDALLLRRRVAPDDFVYVPSGVHAVGPGLLMCEVQQKSDTTYRVYDFDRTDAHGRRRELHLEMAKRVMTVPYDPCSTDTAGPVVETVGGRRRTLVRGEFFESRCTRWNGRGYTVSFPGYELCTVTKGSGDVAFGGENHRLRAGDHRILPANAGPVAFDGAMTSCRAIHGTIPPPLRTRNQRHERHPPHWTWVGP